MKIKTLDLSGVNSSLYASGLPKNVDKEYNITKKDFERLGKLSKAPVGSGHDCTLKGITVNAEVTAGQYWWLQFGRYHFADIVSSESKMHCIKEMDISERCKNVEPVIIDVVEQKIMEYLKGYITKEELISNVPMGLELKAVIVTNYLQLKNIYNQRRNHELKSWQKFCDWIEELPLSDLITGGENNEILS